MYQLWPLIQVTIPSLMDVIVAVMERACKMDDRDIGFSLIEYSQVDSLGFLVQMCQLWREIEPLTTIPSLMDYS